MSDITTASVRPILLVTLAKYGGDQINPNVVLDAATYLELSGEMIRSRICTFSGAEGEELCLRPDMTIPLARMVAKGEIAPGRFYFSGRVFRLPEPGTGEALEFSHTGFENFGAESSPAADAEGVAIGLEALAQAGVRKCEIHLGDSSLFKAFIAAFDLPDPWPAKLGAAYSRQKGPRELIMGQADEILTVSPLARALSGLTEEDAAQAVEEMLSASGITVIGGRTAGDIAHRLVVKSNAEAAGPLPKAAGEAILAFMEVEGEARVSVDAVKSIAKKAGVNVDKALNAFSARLDALADQKVPLKFSSSFGRRFDYYDGLIFEIRSAAAPNLRSIASGGRYDGLVKRLSVGAVEATGFGVAIRPDRVADAANAEASK